MAAERYQVVVHIAQEDLSEAGMVENADGEPLNVGRKTRANCRWPLTTSAVV